METSEYAGRVSLAYSLSMDTPEKRAQKEQFAMKIRADLMNNELYAMERLNTYPKTILT